jgi:hypothetical protein
MKTTTITAAALFLVLTSCNTGNNNEDEIKKLNEQSKQCISIMNKSDAQKTIAMNAGDNATVAAMQKTMDSAALENAKIGQQLMALQSK